MFDEIKEGKKTKIYSQMFIVSYLGAYIATQLGDEIEKLIWMSDRDRIHDIIDSVSFDLFAANYAAMNYCNTELYFATANSTAENWYDEHIRVPDYITGTLADYDLNTNTVSKGKYSTMLEDYFVVASNCLIFRMRRTDDEIGITRLMFEKKNDDYGE